MSQVTKYALLSKLINDIFGYATFDSLKKKCTNVDIPKRALLRTHEE